MSAIIFKFLIFSITLFELTERSQAARLNQIKLDRIIRPMPNTLNLEASQTDDRFTPDKIDTFNKLQTNEQRSNSVLMPYELNENVEESTKNVIYWTPENYPNPFIDFKNCSLEEKGYICDPDEILEQEDSKYQHCLFVFFYFCSF